MPEETYKCPVCLKQRSSIFDPPMLLGQKRVLWQGCPTCYDTFWERLIALVGKLPV